MRPFGRCLARRATLDTGVPLDMLRSSRSRVDGIPHPRSTCPINQTRRVYSFCGVYIRTQTDSGGAGRLPRCLSFNDLKPEIHELGAEADENAGGEAHAFESPWVCEKVGFGVTLVF